MNPILVQPPLRSLTNSTSIKAPTQYSKCKQQKKGGFSFNRFKKKETPLKLYCEM